jgi:hypothetical protein
LFQDRQVAATGASGSAHEAVRWHGGPHHNTPRVDFATRRTAGLLCGSPRESPPPCLRGLATPRDRKVTRQRRRKSVLFTPCPQSAPSSVTRRTAWHAGLKASCRSLQKSRTSPEGAGPCHSGGEYAFIRGGTNTARACGGVDLIRLDPILLNPLTTNTNQRAVGDEVSIHHC